jgi:lysozyme
MQISSVGLGLVKSFEGLFLKAYRCPAGVWTIGYGCTEGVKPGMVWTKDEAEAALLRELSKFEAAVNKLAKVTLNQNQYDALVSFAYNCGEGALSRSGLLKKVNANADGKVVAAEFMKWTRGGGRVLPGLVRRRKAEADLFNKLPL